MPVVGAGSSRRGEWLGSRSSAARGVAGLCSDECNVVGVLYMWTCTLIGNVSWV